MLLRATKSMAHTPPGHLIVTKQDIGVENRVSATYLPLKLGDLGSVPGLDDTLDKVISHEGCLDGRIIGGRSLPRMNPLFSCPIVSAPEGHMSVSRLGFGEDKRVSVVYYPGKVLGDREFTCCGPQLEDCSEIVQVATCMECRGQVSPDLQLNVIRNLDGILPSSLNLGIHSDSLGMMNSEKVAFDHIHKVSGFQAGKQFSVCP